MKNKLLFLFFIVSFSSEGQGLYDNNWCFGDSAGLSFLSGVPQSFVSSLKSQEACASISDSLGNLLFYTNGVNVWDRNNNQMPNGFGLLAYPLFPNYGSSATDGVIILPFPENPNKFLIFTVAGWDTGAFYSVINMTLNGGNGDVELKNINILQQPLYESITAVKHANGKDWWVLSHRKNGDLFYWFLITSLGVTGPFVQHFGPLLSTTTNPAGEFDISKDGSRLLMVTQRSIDVYNIDRCNGMLTNHLPIIYTNNLYDSYGGSFSPNGNLFYVTANWDTIFQYNLNDTPDSIYIKRKIILDNPYYDPSVTGGHILTGMQLGRDNKLYCAIEYIYLPNNLFDSINTKLSVINYPDSIGNICDLTLNSISLGSRRTFLGLPNMPNYNLGKLESVFNESICAGDAYDFNGEQLSTAGIYHDTLTTVSAGCDSLVTLNLTVVSINANIQQSNDTLSVTSSGNVQWFNCETQQIISGATNHVFVPAQSGNYAAIITQGSCSDTSECIAYNGINTLVVQPLFILFPNPATNSLTIEIQNGAQANSLAVTDVLGRTVFPETLKPETSNSIDVSTLVAGVYFVKLQMQNGAVEVRRFVKE